MSGMVLLVPFLLLGSCCVWDSKLGWQTTTFTKVNFTLLLVLRAYSREALGLKISSFRGFEDLDYFSKGLLDML